MDNQTVAATLARLKVAHNRDMAKIQNVEALALAKIQNAQTRASPATQTPSVGDELAELRHVVSDLSEKLHSGSMPGSGMADHLPALIEAATSLASRPRLKGLTHAGAVLYHEPGAGPDHALRPRSVRRTESGLELVYG